MPNDPTGAQPRPPKKTWICVTLPSRTGRRGRQDLVRGEPVGGREAPRGVRGAVEAVVLWTGEGQVRADEPLRGPVVLREVGGAQRPYGVDWVMGIGYPDPARPHRGGPVRRRRPRR
ncbi:hypothetical protein GCM10010124_07140 [Pilimelia terevasa]|uniref:Uncharacterized protein n=1 Tax=Pilimelia terevasa TaxID=53372 RepID=A0A8J3FEJ1_9ACTN|nr:hypothetical protein GCM10010124_07140 [Pilimelia terevasa]